MAEHLQLAGIRAEIRCLDETPGLARRVGRGLSGFGRTHHGVEPTPPRRELSRDIAQFFHDGSAADAAADRDNAPG
jgi:hypothetical protein